MLRKRTAITIAILATLTAVFLMAVKPSGGGESLRLLAKEIDVTVSFSPSQAIIPMELPSINVEQFKTVSVLSTNAVCQGHSGARYNITIDWQFLISSGTFSSSIAQTSGGGCGISETLGASCSQQQILGPHLAARIYATSPDSECGAGICSCTVDEVHLYLQN